MLYRQRHVHVDRVKHYISTLLNAMKGHRQYIVTHYAHGQICETMRPLNYAKQLHQNINKKFKSQNF